MQTALMQVLGDALDGADALIMAAAVADFRPREVSVAKRKRTEEGLVLDLVPNPDLLADIGASRKGAKPVLIGFALETEDGDALVAAARGKLGRKHVDMVVANSASVALGGEDSRVVLVTDSHARHVGPTGKGEIAEEILDFVKGRLA